MARWLMAVVVLCAGLGLVANPLEREARADLYVVDYGVVAYPTNVWTVEGTIYGADPDDVTVYIDGVIGGHFVTVNEDGEFLLSLVLPPGTQGGVTIQAVTWYGDSSDVVEDIIN